MYGFIVVHLEADTQDWNLRQFTISPYTVVYQTYNIGTTTNKQKQKKCEYNGVININNNNDDDE